MNNSPVIVGHCLHIQMARFATKAAGVVFTVSSIWHGSLRKIRPRRGSPHPNALLTDRSLNRGRGGELQNRRGGGGVVKFYPSKKGGWGRGVF